jgi:2-dehydro-3-deoxyphosphogluconate aldolase/(4S)-4-hydroxy-2-oxoglutarate aldolase
MPGCMTLTEIITAMEAGADIIKVFPGSAFGPSIIKAVKGPLPQANLMPTGGVSLDNVSEWIKNGCIAVGAGSSLTKGAKTGDYDKITETAKEFVKRIKEARK